MITSEDIIVSPPIRKIAYWIPNTSAVTPEINAPTAYPKSLQSLKVPILSALCFGLVGDVPTLTKIIGRLVQDYERYKGMNGEFTLI